MSDVKQISDQFKDYASLKSYADSQYKLIVDLSKKINQLEEERNHLKKLLEQSVPIVKSEETKQLESIISSMSDEEAIARMQLKLLRDISLERELTLEECKKTEVYTKLLSIIAAKEKSGKSSNEKLDDSQLLALVKDE